MDRVFRMPLGAGSCLGAVGLGAKRPALIPCRARLPCWLQARSEVDRIGQIVAFLELQGDHERSAEPLPDGPYTHVGWRPAAKSHNEWCSRLMRLWTAALELDPQRGR